MGKTLLMVWTSLVLKLLTHQQENRENSPDREEQSPQVDSPQHAASLMAATFILRVSRLDSSLFAAGILCCASFFFFFVAFLSPFRLTKQSAATLRNITDDAFRNLFSDVTWRTRTADLILGFVATVR